MPEKVLGEVAGLLEEVLGLHSSIRSVVLCTREGVVVASVSRDEEVNPTLLSTISAALVWAGTTTMNNVGSSKPSYLIQSSHVERVLTVLQHQSQLVVVCSRADDAGLRVFDLVTPIHSIGTRIEILMDSVKAMGTGTILGKIVETIPDISQAMVLTIEGLPIGSIGFKNDIEIAALAGSIFANGQTYSDITDTITIASKDTSIIIQKLDEKRLLVIVSKNGNNEAIATRIKDMIEVGF
jgi:predicted regulator of Ras-like GTPase activity (Roadblock/LC7/MglB family)